MTKVFAHRGSSGTHPENTMAAFEEAVRVKADGIELDIQLTQDGELVVIHDYTLERTTNGTGEVKAHTLEQLRKLDAGEKFAPAFKGEKIPTLREVLELVKDTDMELNVEIKSPVPENTGIEKTMVQLLEEYDFLDRIIISSFNHDSLKRVHKLNKDLECAILYMKKFERPWEYAAEVGATALHTYRKETDAELIDEAQKQGCAVRVFTINADEELQKFYSYGTAAVITDFPEKALRLRDQPNA